MKKALCAGLLLGLMLMMTACGESMEIPTEPTQTEPLWAIAPEERPTETTEATTQPAETAPLPPETTEVPETTAAAPAETVPETTETPETQATAYPMEEKFTSAEGTRFVKKGVNCRDQANVDSSVVAILPQGLEVVRVGVSPDGWTAILYEDNVRYVSTDYLVEEQPEVVEPNTVNEQEMDDQVYTNHRVKLREGPGMDRAVLVMIPEYTELHRIASTNTGWYKVEYQDKVGYVAESYVMPKYVDSEDNPTEEVVDETVITTREVNLRKGPSTERQILDRVPEGTQIHRIATTSNEWSKVEYKEHTGYISNKYLETVTAADG